jgi:hypothetical protein
MEFACHVTNYPERENFKREVMDVRVLDMSWQQGTGILVSAAILCNNWYFFNCDMLLILRYT